MNKNLIFTIIFFFTLLLTFTILRLPQLSPTLSDENVYFYMGKLISEGYLPYKDFFHAHPPFKILLYGIFIKLFGFRFIILKSIALIATLISALFIFLSLVKKGEYMTGLIAIFLFLFTATTFFFSTMNFGHNLTTMFIVISYFFFLQKKYLVSGLLSGIASITGLYSLPLIIIFILASFFISTKESKRYIYGFLAIFFSVNLLMVFISGFEFIKQVYIFHFLKAESATTSKLLLLRNILVSNMIISVPLLIYFLMKRNLSVRIEEVLIIFYMIFILLLKNPFMFYFIVIFPFASILGGEGLMKIFNILPKIWKILFVILACAFFIFSINRNMIFEKSQDKQNKFNKFYEMSEYVKSHSKPNDTIAGDTYITPLISLDSKRRISGNIVDIDPSIFKSGVYDLHSAIDKLIENKVRFMLMHKVSTQKSQFWYQPELAKLRPFCSSEDKAVRFIENDNVYLVYECNFPE